MSIGPWTQAKSIPTTRLSETYTDARQTQIVGHTAAIAAQRPEQSDRRRFCAGLAELRP